MDLVHGLLANPDVQSSLATLLIALAGFLATALSGAGISFIRSKTSAATFEQLQLFASYAVLAAEQGSLAGAVNDKKASAINVVNGYLKAAGITSVTAADIDAAIEAAVLRQFNAHKVQPSIPPFSFPFPLPTPEGGEEEGTPTPTPEEGNG